MAEKEVSTGVQTLSFERFWDWIQLHPNCIIRAGSGSTVIFDDEDFHWHFALEGRETYLVQMIRGKRMIAELLIEAQDVAYVQHQVGEHDEYLFDLIAEGADRRDVVCHFVVTHGFEEGDDAEGTPGGGSSGRWTH